MLVTLYKIGKVHFRLFFGTNGFHVKAENERFTTAGWQKISRRHLTDYVSKMHRKACSSIIPHWTNQIIDFWCCRSRSCRRFLNSLVSFWCTVESHIAYELGSRSLPESRMSCFLRWTKRGSQFMRHSDSLHAFIIEFTDECTHDLRVHLNVLENTWNVITMNQITPTPPPHFSLHWAHLSRISFYQVKSFLLFFCLLFVDNSSVRRYTHPRDPWLVWKANQEIVRVG